VIVTILGSVKNSIKWCGNFLISESESFILILAERAGKTVAKHELQMINEKPVLLSWRFDRNQQERIPFLSAMSLLQAKDGERASYVEIVDELSQHGARYQTTHTEY